MILSEEFKVCILQVHLRVLVVFIILLVGLEEIHLAVPFQIRKVLCQTAINNIIIRQNFFSLEILDGFRSNLRELVCCLLLLIRLRVYIDGVLKLDFNSWAERGSKYLVAPRIERGRLHIYLINI
jgi:hypothetical protein